MKTFLSQAGRTAISALVLAAPLAAADGPPRNPWLADSAYPVSHHNPGQTDSTPINGPDLGRRVTPDEVQTVPLLWSSAPTFKNVGEDTIVIAANPAGIIKVRATGEDFSLVSNVPYPGRENVHAKVTDEKLRETMLSIDDKRRDKQDLRLLLNSLWMFVKFEINLRTFPSGAYSVIDRDGYHYTNFDRHFLVKSFDNNRVDQPLLPVKHANIVAQLPPADAEQVSHILGITMTYDGYIVAAAGGAVMVVDRDLQVMDHAMFPGEHVENSVAVDEAGGIYVVTSQNMHKLVWNGQRLSQDAADGAWSSPYEVMEEGRAKALGAASHGSGTTPSLLGFGEDEDRLVVISDGSPDGANLVAFWRDAIPQGFRHKPGTLSRRIADQIPMGISVTTIEASPVTHDNGVLVINSTYPEPGPIPGDLVSNAFLSGTTRAAPLGIRKFNWLPREDRFEESWNMPDIDNTDWMPPAVSTANGLVYIANRRDDTYEYLAADWKTGEVKAVWPFPDDSVLYNNWGGITVFLEDGDLLLGGFFAIKRYDIGGLRAAP
jgi:hypothetical protein